jgi:thioredoxin 2
VAELLAGEAAVVQINSDESPRLSARFMVRGIPVVHLLRKGSSVDQLQGAQSAESVASWFRRSAKGR